MERIAIVTDTISCIPRDKIQEYDIKVVPSIIFYKNISYREWIDLTIEKAYQFLEESPESWHSSAAPPEEYIRLYRKLGQSYDKVLVITVSSKLSMFYNGAITAKDIVERDLKSVEIEVIDSETASAAQGFIVLEAAKQRRDGKSFVEIIEKVNEVKRKVKFLCLLETLKHVYRTGRMPKILSQFGSVLPVKPILTISNGVVRLLTSARTKTKGIEKMLDIMFQDIGNKMDAHVAIMHADCLLEAEEVKKVVIDNFNCKEVFITEFSPIIGYATGKGTIALAYY